jgi:WD40 repeat protein
MEGNDVPKHGEDSGRMGQVSVTCMSFLAQENLLVTGSEKDATIKLWDLRSLHRPQKGRPVPPIQYPVSETAYPESHNQWRHFGTTSISISGDGSRLYSLCKDNTVYAYSTTHLILGHAPELSHLDGVKRFPTKETKAGLGPICGYRHPKLFATSFYVKSAIRKAKDDKCEMLAVGSNDGCVVLFPTDDVYFPKHELGEEAIERPPSPVPQSQTQPASSYFRGRPKESLPISSNGTALIRGHNKEVNSLSWSSEGNLISIADDFLVRVWRDDADGYDAEDLRMGGEHSGRTWGCGWADVKGDFDDDESTLPGEKAKWVSRLESP